MKSKLAWIPNSITMGNLFCGFLAILFTIRGLDFYHYAMLMMLVAAVLDFFDGYVARRLGVSSEVGRELDSLADVVSFGVAPAVLLYERALKDTHSLGIIVVAFFVCCAAFRLARHNVLASSGHKSYFTGMPIEGGATILIAFVLSQQHHITSPAMKCVAMVSVLIAGLFMVSSLRFTANIPWVIRIGALIFMVFAIIYPGIWTLLIPFAYVAYGVLNNIHGIPCDEMPCDTPLPAMAVGEESAMVQENIALSK
ncbi:MAG TPA: CDP-diacylglycerol--serine O-phosphatidyltransferase [Armatimonadota bacterium]|nr:CDP-diacylglycerol--serine O-phosphatidyltransferase [Armatimonadota bacterium]